MQREMASGLTTVHLRRPLCLRVVDGGKKTVHMTDRTGSVRLYNAGDSIEVLDLPTQIRVDSLFDGIVR
jgi:hypothetical protein